MSPKQRARAKAGAPEQLEKRHLLAFDFVSAYVDDGEAFYVTNVTTGAELSEAPQQITLRFTPGVKIDPNSLNGVSVVRSGGADDRFGDQGSLADITVTPGAVVVDDFPNQNQVVIRFAESLPDDVYRITLASSVNPESGIISGLSTIEDVPQAFRGGDSFSFDVRVSVGQQVVSVVPQPISRADAEDVTAGLVQDRNAIAVYFDPAEALMQASAETTAHYKLIEINAQGQDVAGSQKSPQSVVYDAGAHRALLTFAAGDMADGKLYRLEIGGPGILGAVEVINEAGGGAGTSFDTAQLVAAPGAGGTLISGSISLQPQIVMPGDLPPLLFPTQPGTLDEPGQRGVPVDSGEHGLPEWGVTPAAAIPDILYNFRVDYGSVGGQQLFNLITEEQKRRTREIFDIYSRYTGVRFIESANQGITVATGNIFALGGGDVSVTGVAGRAAAGRIGGNSTDGYTITPGNLVVMNGLFDWGQSEYGGQWFQVAMHEIGHALGLSHSYDMPSNMGQPGSLTEGVFPGDYDLGHLVQLFPKTGSDIDLYTFELPEAGRLTAETIVGRVGQVAKSTLDTVLTLYREEMVDGTAVRTMIARNDDSVGLDSFVELDLEAGTYFVAVTSTGNTDFDPSVANSGYGGRTDGAYDLKLSFVPRSSAATTIVDASGTPLDGDRDGTAGGAFNFWFRTAAEADTIFVDKIATDVLVDVSQSAAATPNLVVEDTTGINPGMLVLGQGIPAGTTVSTVDSGTQVTLSTAVTVSAAAKLRFVTPGDGSLARPFLSIADAMQAVDGDTKIIRIIGNEGTELTGTTNSSGRPSLRPNALVNSVDPYHYYVGLDVQGRSLADGASLTVPAGVTVMIDEGAVFRMSGANVDVGSSSELVSRTAASLQVLGTPDRSVQFTSTIEDATTGGSVTQGPLRRAARGGDWGGIVFRADSDWQPAGVLQPSTVRPVLNTISNAVISYGGGQVIVDAERQSFSAVQIEDTRPTVVFSAITYSADAAISATPNSFEEGHGHAGPQLRGNTLLQNSINGVFLAVRTQLGSPLDRLGVPARLTSTEVTYVLQESLIVTGGAGYYYHDNAGALRVRAAGRLQIDPGVVLKLQSARIELERGAARMIAEGEGLDRVIFTSLGDNRFGAGGTFDTNGNLPDTYAPGDWAGILLNVGSAASIDNALIGFAGGEAPLEGGLDRFNVIEVHQADLRLANSRIENNASGLAETTRSGRGTNDSATIFVRGAQPVIVGNDFRDNAGTMISVNVNALNDVEQGDPGRQSGMLGRFEAYDDNVGPLIRDNRVSYAEVPFFGDQGSGDVGTAETFFYRLEGGQIVRSRIDGSEASVVASPSEDGWAIDLFDVDKESGIIYFSETSGADDPSNTRVFSIRADGQGRQVISAGELGWKNTSLAFDPVSKKIFLHSNDPAPVTADDTNDDGKIQVISLNGTVTILPETVHFVPSMKVAEVGGVRSLYYATAANEGSDLPVGLFRRSLDEEGIPSAQQETLVNVPVRAFAVLSSGSIFYADGSTDEGSQFLYRFDPATFSTQQIAADESLIVDIAIDEAAGQLYWLTAEGVSRSRFDGTNEELVLTADGVTEFAVVEETTGGQIDAAALAGMLVRGGEIAVEGVWDDTDIVHIVTSEIVVDNFHTATGLRLMSDSAASLVVKLEGPNAGFTATGTPLDIEDRIGGTIQIIGQPGFPVILTSLKDDSVGAGANLLGFPITDTNLDGNLSSPAPGDWRSLEFQHLANDRNVAVVEEREAAYSQRFDPNGVLTGAELLGTLAPNYATGNNSWESAQEKSGDESRRYGFEVHGSIAYDAAGDVDIYTFNGYAGSEVWIDIDKTSSSLDSMVELLDASGRVLARSADSQLDTGVASGVVVPAELGGVAVVAGARAEVVAAAGAVASVGASVVGAIEEAAGAVTQVTGVAARVVGINQPALGAAVDVEGVAAVVRSASTGTTVLINTTEFDDTETGQALRGAGVWLNNVSTGLRVAGVQGDIVTLDGPLTVGGNDVIAFEVNGQISARRLWISDSSLATQNGALYVMGGDSGARVTSILDNNVIELSGQATINFATTAVVGLGFVDSVQKSVTRVMVDDTAGISPNAKVSGVTGLPADLRVANGGVNGSIKTITLSQPVTLSGLNNALRFGYRSGAVPIDTDEFDGLLGGAAVEVQGDASSLTVGSIADGKVTFNLNGDIIDVAHDDVLGFSIQQESSAISASRVRVAAESLASVGGSVHLDGIPALGVTVAAGGSVTAKVVRLSGPATVSANDDIAFGFVNGVSVQTTQVRVADPTGIVDGALVSGDGVPGGTRVVGNVDPNGTLTLSQAITTQGGELGFGFTGTTLKIDTARLDGQIAIGASVTRNGVAVNGVTVASVAGSTVTFSGPTDAFAHDDEIGILLDAAGQNPVTYDRLYLDDASLAGSLVDGVEIDSLGAANVTDGTTVSGTPSEFGLVTLSSDATVSADDLLSFAVTDMASRRLIVSPVPDSGTITNSVFVTMVDAAADDSRVPDGTTVAGPPVSLLDGRQLITLSNLNDAVEVVVGDELGFGFSGTSFVVDDITGIDVGEAVGGPGVPAGVTVVGTDQATRTVTVSRGVNVKDATSLTFGQQTFKVLAAAGAPAAVSILPGAFSGTIEDDGTVIQTFTAARDGTLSFTAVGGAANRAQTGSVDYETGVVSLAFTNAPRGGVQIRANYDYSRVELATLGFTAAGGNGAYPMQKDVWRGGDFYSVNPRDAGMRVILPGTPGTLQKYLIRVRSQPTPGADRAGHEANLVNPALVGEGATKGSYELRVRTRQQDEKPGSTVRYADIRYPVVGVDAIGLPNHSPLVGEAGENVGDAGDTFAAAQQLGNVLTSDRGRLSVAGEIASPDDIDWYTFTLTYEDLQQINGAAGPAQTWAAIFDIDYADGFRGDLMLSVFSSNGTLLFQGNDSNIIDDQPGLQQGSDFDDLSRGSYGKLDPFIGPATLSAGAGGGGFTYFVAVSSAARAPQVLSAGLTRREPVNSIDRVVEDHIGTIGYVSGDGSSQRQINPTNNAPLIDISELETHVEAFDLSDIVLFVSAGNAIYSANPLTGTRGGAVVTQNHSVGDIEMLANGRLYQAVGVVNDISNVATLQEIDPNTNRVLSTQGDGVVDRPRIDDFDPDTDWWKLSSDSVDALAIGRTAPGTYSNSVYYSLRDGSSSVLYHARSNGSAAFTANQPFSRKGPIRGDGITGRVTGLQFRNDEFASNGLYGVSEGGQFFTVNPGTGAATLIADFSGTLGESLQGLAAAPVNVNSAAYRGMFFAITASGRLICINPDTGTLLQNVFDTTGEDGIGDSAISNPIITGATGLAFSPLDINLWHPTTERGNDAGHGINSTADNTRGAVPGGMSMRFGLDRKSASQPGQYGADSPWQQELSTNPAIANSYHFPGGARGVMTTNAFSLAGYEAADKPTLYFTYFLDMAEDANARNRVALGVSIDDGASWRSFVGWQSWNGQLTPNPAVLDNVAAWRQGRFDLGGFAGESSIRFRFEFEASGDIGGHEGFFFDDVIVGFAERGEMVTGANVGQTDFTGPITQTGRTYQGPYQLEIRHGSEYASGTTSRMIYQTLDTNDRFTLPVSGGGLFGDSNTLREQGQFVVENNIVSHAQTFGIRIDAFRDAAADPYGNFTGATNFAQPGSVRNLPVLNGSRLVPGAVIRNNIVAGSGTSGILFSGASDEGSVPTAAVPYGRIVNNTIYGGPDSTASGITITDNAGPTILNNVFAQLAVGVDVDATSRFDAAGNERTVIGTSAFHAVGRQVANATAYLSQELLADPFLNATAGNFYPAAITPLIDSALGSLQDRNSFTIVTEPLGIPPSPIVAPDFDLFGQLRSDDPDTANAPGLGGEVFKDRGAVERIDRTLPTASLAVPVDNGGVAPLNDRDPENDVVLIEGRVARGVPRFVVQLSDVGVGIDHASVVTQAVTVLRDGVLLADGTDYFFQYNRNTSQIILESTVVFPLGDYVIELRAQQQTGVAEARLVDLANNPILPNALEQAPGQSPVYYTSLAVSLLDAPSVPTQFTAQAGDGTVTLQWNAPNVASRTPVTAYIVEYSLDGGENWTDWTASQTNPLGGTNVTIPDLQNSDPYLYRVRGVNKIGQGPATAAVRAKPSQPRAVAGVAGEERVALTWQAPVNNGGSPVTGYLVDKSIDNGSTWARVAADDIAFAGEAATVTRLAKGQPIRFRVAAITAAGQGTWSAASAAVTPEGVPDKPTNLAASLNPADGSIRLSWSAPSNNGGKPITGYTLWYSDGVNSPVEMPNLIGRTQNVPGPNGPALEPGATYTFKVRASNFYGLGDWSAELQQSAPTVPQVPPVITAVQAGLGSVTVEWTAPSLQVDAMPIADYVIQKSQDDGATWTTVADGVSIATSSTVTGLSRADGPHRFRVAAKNALAGVTDDDLVYSVASDAVSPLAAAGAVQGLGGVVGDRQVTLSWSLPADDGGAAITDYRIEQSANGGATWTTFEDGVATSRTVTVTGLTNGLNYVFRVAAVTSAGPGAPATTGQLMPLGPPAAVTGLTGALVNGGVTLQWTAPASTGGRPITGYRVEYQAVSSTDWSIHSTVTATTETVTGLTAGQGYRFRVSGVNAQGVGESASIGPLVIGVPAPSGLVATPDNARITLAWVPPTVQAGVQIIGYAVEYRLQTATEWTAFAHDGTATTATLTGLENGQRYDVRVAAVTPTGPGSFATVQATPFLPPVAPSIVSATNGGQSAQLVWSAPTAGGTPVTDYVIEYRLSSAAAWVRYNDGVSTSLTALIGGLSQGQTYAFRVAAKTALGMGAFSTPVTLIIGSLPAAPTRPAAWKEGDNISVVWDAVTPPSGVVLSGYQVEYRRAGTTTWSVGGTSAVNNVLLSGRLFSRGVRYEFRVAAVANTGIGSYSNTASTTY